MQLQEHHDVRMMKESPFFCWKNASWFQVIMEMPYCSLSKIAPFQDILDALYKR